MKYLMECIICTLYSFTYNEIHSNFFLRMLNKSKIDESVFKMCGTRAVRLTFKSIDCRRKNVQGCIKFTF